MSDYRSINRVLIANRGEIAIRIIRACRDTGRTAIAVYSDADADAHHTQLADEAYALGGTTPAESYLDAAKIIDRALEAKADAVHPGYGFLSESADFAQAVQDAGLIWIGPSPEAIRKLGDKVSARALATGVGAPLVVGSPGPVESGPKALEFAQEHGLPIAIKAAHGGGGRGIRVVWSEDEVEEMFDAAVREAVQAFGRGECFVEQYLDQPRHVEVQILADSHGGVVAVGSRDCSLQRRNQKLVEEAPAPGLDDAQRERLLDSARDICAAAEYEGAGTVEYLLSRDGTLSFLEVNTRLQVEHPVTEETSELDLVIEQFRIAEGRPLSEAATEAGRRARAGELRAHSMEFRINAEDPGRGFLPSPGTIDRFEVPLGPGVRVDAGYRSGDALSGAYDSMLGKLIVTGPDRATVIARARRALAEFHIEGVATVLPFHRAVLEEDAFTGADLAVHTRWIETEFSFDPAASAEPPSDRSMIRLWVELDGRRVQFGLPTTLLAHLGGLGGGEVVDTEVDEGPAEGSVVSPVAGTLAKWLVDDGEQVTEGQSIAIVEAMKMETPIPAPADGVLRHDVDAGSLVAADQAVGHLDD